MVVDYLYQKYSGASAGPFNLNDKPVLVIHTHGVLVAPVAPELLEMQRSHLPKVSLIPSSPDPTDDLAITPDRPKRQPCIKPGVNLQAVQFIIRKLDIHELAHS